MIIIKGCHLGLRFNLQGQLFFFFVFNENKKICTNRVDII